MKFLIWRLADGSVGFGNSGEEVIVGRTIKSGSIVTVAAVIKAGNQAEALELFHEQHPPIVK